MFDENKPSLYPTPTNSHLLDIPTEPDIPESHQQFRSNLGPSYQSEFADEEWTPLDETIKFTRNMISCKLILARKDGKTSIMHALSTSDAGKEINQRLITEVLEDGGEIVSIDNPISAAASQESKKENLTAPAELQANFDLNFWAGIPKEKHRDKIHELTIIPPQLGILPAYAAIADAENLTIWSQDDDGNAVKCLYSFKIDKLFEDRYNL